MNYTVISTENRGSVGIITLKRPEALNAVNRQMLEELAGAVAAFEADDTLRFWFCAAATRLLPPESTLRNFMRIWNMPSNWIWN